MARFMRSYGKSHLEPPVVIGAGIVFPPIRITTVAVRTAAEYPRHRSQYRHNYRLHGPAVVGAGIAFHGPSTRLTAPGSRSAAVRHALAPPAVVVTVTPLTRKTTVALAASRRGHARSNLGKPAVVAAGVAFHGPSARLVTPVNKRSAVSHTVGGPVVVSPAASVQIGAAVALTYSRRGATRSRLSQPAAVAQAAAPVAPVAVHLAAQRPRSRTRPQLFPPARVAAGIAFHGPSARLVAPVNGRQLVRHRLSAPIVVTPAPPVVTALVIRTAPTHRGRTLSALRPPAVVGRGVAFHGPSVRIVNPANRRAPVAHRLPPPTAVGPPAAVAAGITVRLAYSRRGLAKTRLEPPTSVGNGLAFYGPGVRLVAPINTRRPVQHLVLPPVTVTPVAAPVRPTDTTLVRGRQAGTHPRLARPVVVGAGVVFRPINVTVARIKPPKRFFQLRPPVVVQSAVLLFFGPTVRVVASKRGAPKSRLASPAVVGAGIVFAPVRVSNARNRIPKRFWHLSAPTVVQPATLLFFGPKTALTDSSRGRPFSRLHPPATVGNGIVFRPVDTTLAPSRRGKARSILSAPVPPQPPARPISTALNRIRPPRTRTALKAPTVVLRPLARPLAVTVARIRPAATRPVLRHPAVVFTATELRIRVTLTRNKPAHTTRRIGPPARIGAGIVFRPTKTTLTRIRPFPTTTRLQPPTVLVLIVPGHGTISDHASAKGTIGDFSDYHADISDTSTSTGTIGDRSTG